MPEYTRNQLLDRAKSKGIKGRHKMKKAELLTRLGLKETPKKKSSKKTKKKSSKKTKKVRFSPRSAFHSPEIMIYTMEGCPYCTMAKDLLTKKNMPFKSQVINKDNQEQIYKQVDHLTGGYRKFPMIMMDGQFFGGYGKLEEKYA